MINLKCILVTDFTVTILVYSRRQSCFFI